MTDIVERLRGINAETLRPWRTAYLCEESADEIERLREFARYMLVEGAFQGRHVDGGDIQAKAHDLDLIEMRPCKPEDAIDGETEHYFVKWAAHD